MKQRNSNSLTQPRAASAERTTDRNPGGVHNPGVKMAEMMKPNQLRRCWDRILQELAYELVLPSEAHQIYPNMWRNARNPSSLYSQAITCAASTS